MKIEGLPVIGVDESEEITVAVRADKRWFFRCDAPNRRLFKQLQKTLTAPD
jgi:hypothetical protein